MKCLILTAVAMTAATSHAHDGRRFEVKVVDGRLVAQGYNSTGFDDGAGDVRPYTNALHDHWTNLGPAFGATADLPGFDLFEPGPLVGHGLTLTLVGATKWVDPPMVPTFLPAGLEPVFVPLEAGEIIAGAFGGEVFDTDSLGSVTLEDAVAPGGFIDLDVVYGVAFEPADVIYALEFTLSTDAPGVVDSAPVYVILSPDGPNGMVRRHFASLKSEQTLGQGFCAVDAAEPAGVLNFNDVIGLLTWFGDGDPRADFAEPFGVLNFNDVIAFLADFGAGCP